MESSGQTSAAGTEPEVPPPGCRLNLGLCWPPFNRHTEHEIDHEWLTFCAYTSRWRYDQANPDGDLRLRHERTGLTYYLHAGNDGAAYAQQYMTACCPANEQTDPYYVVGFAARRVAEHIFQDHREKHGGRFFISFRFRGFLDLEPWRDAIIEPAPPVPIHSFWPPRVSMGTPFERPPRSRRLRR